MRRPHVLAATLSLALGACQPPTPPTSPPPAPPSQQAGASGTAMLSRYSLDKDHPSAVRLGGRTFYVTPDHLTWDHGGSLALPGAWGLLELVDAPRAIAVNLDGVKLADVAK